MKFYMNFHPLQQNTSGQGRGLGLSMSYDIIKAHGGELKVETKEDEGSEFVIQLPV
jgi:signal transduction histidine kinase